MKKLLAAAAACCALVAPTHASNGVVTVAAESGVAEVTDRLEALLLSKGMTVMARVKHSDAAAGVGVELRDTQLLIFGNPKVGSPLMRCEQMVALDLPQKALVYADAEGRTWIAYNDPAYLQQRHAVQGCDEAFAKVSGALAKLTAAAAKAP